jgi:hypothetical protein
MARPPTFSLAILQALLRLLVGDVTPTASQMACPAKQEKNLKPLGFTAVRSAITVTASHSSHESLVLGAALDTIYQILV